MLPKALDLVHGQLVRLDPVLELFLECEGQGHEVRGAAIFQTGRDQSVLAETLDRPFERPLPRCKHPPRVRRQTVQRDQQLAPHPRPEVILAQRDQMNDPPKDLLDPQHLPVVHVQLEQPRVERLQQGQAVGKGLDQQVDRDVRQGGLQGVVRQLGEETRRLSVLPSLVQSQEPACISTQLA